MLLSFKDKERIFAKEKVKIDMMDQALEKFNREIESLALEAVKLLQGDK